MAAMKATGQLVGTRPVIFLGVDGSWRETGALEWAIQESVLRGEPLSIVHVIDERLRKTPYLTPATVDGQAMELIQQVRSELPAADHGASHLAKTVIGHPATTLAALAEGSRMLVVGRRGIGSFQRLLIGSTSEALANQARVPVVVVPDRWKPPRGAVPVIVGIDDSPQSEAAIDFAATAATERKVPVRLVHVWDLPNVYSWEARSFSDIEGDLAEHAERRVAAIADQWGHKYPDLEIQTEVRRSHPVRGLLEAADEAGAQLLVIGGRNRSRAASWLLGSTGRGVLHHATCPVAIVHEPRTD
ncbi:universal stress protein [Streptomyces sp. SID13031]|uniref:universal stress protein n=1 Tax=Streptomyces sp. SID13031 TaxID=2706046 RepID=UPI0013CC4D04|nr:universal stress protein [Streptomyces sp. SID13031]NEA33977.1 universal stress protein [Streptomyces sp. SID13031]